MNYHFFSFINITTLVLAVLFLTFGLVSIKKNRGHWGKNIIFGLLFGVIICIVAAIRDGFGFETGSIIAFTGAVSGLLSSLGALIVLSAASTLFVKRNGFRKAVFILINLLFVVKFILMEAIRLSVILG